MCLRAGFALSTVATVLTKLWQCFGYDLGEKIGCFFFFQKVM